MQRAAAQGEDLARIFEHYFACWSEADAFGAAVEKPLPVLLLQLPDLRAHCGLRAQHLFRSTGEIAEFGDLEKGVELVKVHKTLPKRQIFELIRQSRPFSQRNPKMDFWEIRD
jgi:hypothetical protein